MQLRLLLNLLLEVLLIRSLDYKWVFRIISNICLWSVLEWKVSQEQRLTLNRPNHWSAPGLKVPNYWTVCSDKCVCGTWVDDRNMLHNYESCHNGLRINWFVSQTDMQAIACALVIYNSNLLNLSQQKGLWVKSPNLDRPDPNLLRNGHRQIRI